MIKFMINCRFFPLNMNGFFCLELEGAKTDIRA